MYVSQKTLLCFLPKTWNLIGKPPYWSLTFTQECSFQWKNPFLVVGEYCCKATLFQISWLKLQKLIKSCWPSKTESWLQWVTCWNNFVRISTHSESRHWNMAKSMRESEFHPCRVFSTSALMRQGCHVKREFCTLQ